MKDITLPPDLIKKVEDSYLYWLDRANKLFGFNHIPELKYKFLGRTAGKANFFSVTLNPYFLIHNTEGMLNDTIPHEISHSVQEWRWPNAKQWHGPEFRQIMRAFGLTPNRCHNYESSDNLGRVPRKHVYRCVVCAKTYNVTKLIHGKITNGQVRRCKCKGNIIYVGEKQA